MGISGSASLAFFLRLLRLLGVTPSLVGLASALDCALECDGDAKKIKRRHTTNQEKEKKQKQIVLDGV